MSIFNHLATQHRDSVAFVFSKYGIKKPVTANNIRRAIIAGKNTPFYQDLTNAMCLQNLGKNYYEDDYDYSLVNMDEENYDSETVGITDTFEYDYLDRSARKLKRKQKKVVRKQKRTTKKDQRKAAKASSTGGNGGDIAEAEVLDGGGNDRLSKVETGLNVVGQLATAAGGIAAQFKKDSASGDGSAGTNDSPEDDNSENPTGIKKHLPLIIGGVAFVAIAGVLFYFLKKKNK